MAINQIPKNKSISFNEYIHNIGTTPSILTSDWGFFVPLEPNSYNMCDLVNIKQFNDIIDIDEISETMFEMDCPTESTPNTISYMYTNIKSKLFVVSSFILYKVVSICYNE
jgi:hypothetical protein